MFCDVNFPFSYRKKTYMADTEASAKEVRMERNRRYNRNFTGGTYSNRGQRNFNYRRNYNQNSSFSASRNNGSQSLSEIANRNIPESSTNNYSSANATVENAPSASLNEESQASFPPVNTYDSSLDQVYRPSDKYHQNSTNNSDSKKKYRSRQNKNDSRKGPATNSDYNHESVHRTEKNKTQKREKYRNAPHQDSSYQNFDKYSNHREQCPDSQRGKIVGGRYIRKNVSNSVPRSQSYNSFENDASSTETCFPSSRERNHNEQQRTYYDLDYNRDYVYESTNRVNASSRRKNHYTPRKHDNNSSPTDIYHYSIVPDVKKVSSPPKAVYNIGSQSSKLSRYKEDDANQRELLIHHLKEGECECLVCCELIRVKDQSWHCLSCYHVFHLRCIRKWARSPAAVVEDGGWRCPACQSLTSKVPSDYFCFCGKQKNPDVNFHITPHSCGEICGRKRPDCSHLCKELCHPGPCPTCLIVVQKSCACGKTFKTTTCKQSTEETCNSICDKLLNCGVHLCKSLCHSGNCLPCEAEVSQKCYCGRDKRTIECTEESSTVEYFSCGNLCEKLLNCGRHKCSSICHPDACKLCNLSTEVITHCPCGKFSIQSLVATGKTTIRKSCEDPIPVCGGNCEKILFCGPKDNPHKCNSSCHTGKCPPCLLTTSIKCRCESFTKEFKCAEISSSFVYNCEKRCNRRKNCGRHKCLNKCCVNTEHKCELICNKKLTCSKHQCQETCHAGNCPICPNVSFDELRCHCGESVLYPPIHCGVKPPECSKPCTRTHSCDHEVKHTCHSDDTCPPCTSLTVKWCYGHHKQCGSVMCFMDGVSCGMLCQKPLACEKHVCQLTCHPGPCHKPGERCTQVCTVPRESCGHLCGNSCHEGPCQETPCRAQVTLTCPCGHRSENTTCYDSSKNYRLMSVSVLATKMQEIKEGQSVNLNDVLGRKSKNNKLQCNEECAVIERNKRLALALQIQNPDLSCNPGPPSYSEFLKSEAKKNPSLVADIYNKISDLVQLAKESKQKCRSHSFPPMNREQRRAVHELAEFFGCETQSYDEEPKKNVVVTAYKTKCWLPFVSIMTVVQRDMGFRKGPAPVLAQRDSKSISGANNTANNQKKKIDYFDFKE